MKLSTTIMVSIMGVILALTLGKVIGVFATLVLSFILGGVVTYINERYNTLF